ncbi:MAG: tetratricopeptide repeat protein [Candidatus Korarchaeum sp.]
MDLRAFLSKVIDLIGKNMFKILEYFGYAALALAASYLAISEVGSELLQSLGQPLMQEAFNRLKKRLGKRKFSEEDVKQILEIAEEDAEVRKDLLYLTGAVIELAKEEGLEVPWLDDLARGLNELREKFEDLRGQIDVIRRDVDELRERVRKLEGRVTGLEEAMRGLIRESYIEPLWSRGRLEASSAAELAARAVEKSPATALEVLDAALKREKDERDMIMDAVALRAPGKIGEWLRERGYDWKRAFDLASDMEAPSATLEIYGFAEGPLRELVKSDERFKPYLARVLNNLGESYRRKGMLDEAIKLHEEARSIYEELFKLDERFKPDLARALNNLGLSYSDKGMLDRAIELQERAKSIYEELSRSDERFKPDLARALNNLGISYYDKGMLDRAIELQERAKSIYEELVRFDERRFKPDLAVLLNNLGESYRRKGMLDRAIKLHEEARSIFEELARFDERFKPYLAKVLNNLGLSYHGKGMLDRAIELYKEARSIYEELVKLDERFKPDLANTLLSKALALYQKGNLEEALSHICEAYELLSGAPETQERNELLEIALKILSSMGKSLEDCGGQRDRGLR